MWQHSLDIELFGTLIDEAFAFVACHNEHQHCALQEPPPEPPGLLRPRRYALLPGATSYVNEQIRREALVMESFSKLTDPASPCEKAGL